MPDQTTTELPVGSDALVRPARITEEMVRLAFYGCKSEQRPVDPWHVAANLNAMMEHGYCPKCGLVPDGCEREGCGPNATAHLRATKESP
jgi:hypothetical protein